MKSDRRAGLWIVAASAATLFSIVIVFAFVGAGEKGTVAALRVSARLSFLLFWAAYAGGALASLFGPRFESLARRGRDFGLAFAAALSVHLGLVVWFCHISTPPFRIGHLAVAELIGAVWIYALAVFSIKRLRNAISPHLWRLMRTLGMEYIALIFAYNFALDPTDIRNFPFLLLIIGAMMLRIIAGLRYWRQTNRTALP